MKEDGPKDEASAVGHFGAPVSSEGGVYAEVKSAIVNELESIRLYHETVQKVEEGHPEVRSDLPSIIAAVHNAVTNPTLVAKSYGSSYIYVDHGSTNASGDPLRVPVKVVGEKTGRIRSFFFAEANFDEDVVYRRSDD